MSILLPPISAHLGHRAGMWRLRLQLPMVRPLPPGLLRMTEASTRSALGSRAERLLGLAISPYLIATASAVAAGGVAATRPGDLPLWLVLVAGAAGWSSAWSP